MHSHLISRSAAAALGNRGGGFVLTPSRVFGGVAVSVGETPICKSQSRPSTGGSNNREPSADFWIPWTGDAVAGMRSPASRSRHFFFKHKMRTSIETAKTSVELNAGLVAKLRASLRAINDDGTAEQFINEWMETIFEVSESGGISGLMESFIETDDPSARLAAESKLARIRKGDKRLVRPEPLPRNARIHSRELDRVNAIAAATGLPHGGTLNALLDYALGKFERGEITSMRQPA